MQDYRGHRGQLVYRFDISLSDVASQAIRDFGVEWQPFRCRVRLRGTRSEQFQPKDKVKHLHDVATWDLGWRDDYLAEMGFVATSRRPVFARDRMTTRFGTARDLFAGIPPLSTDGARVDILVVIEDLAGLSLEDFDLK